jgi:hypothetical protein
MPLRGLALTLLLLAWPASLAGQGGPRLTEEPGRIFRTVDIAPFGWITLGQPFAQRDAIGEQVADTVYQLPPGLGDTETILVHVDSANVVAAMTFVYRDGKSFEGARAIYALELGAPDRSEEVDAEGGHVTRLRWEDGITCFELFRRQAPNAAPTVWSVLREL